jgi:hypothetical protein
MPDEPSTPEICDRPGVCLDPGNNTQRPQYEPRFLPTRTAVRHADIANHTSAAKPPPTPPLFGVSLIISWPTNILSRQIIYYVSEDLSRMEYHIQTELDFGHFWRKPLKKQDFNQEFKPLNLPAKF